MKKTFLTFTTGIVLALGAPQALAEKEQSQKKEDSFEKAGDATENALEKAGKGTKKGLEATGKGVGEAAEHTGRAAVTAGKATAGAFEKTGEAIADFFGGDGDDYPDREGRVKEAQRVLQDKGYYAAAIDGIPGPKTRAGLRQFQRDNDLEETGTLNRETAKKLGLD